MATSNTNKRHRANQICCTYKIFKCAVSVPNVASEREMPMAMSLAKFAPIKTEQSMPKSLLIIEWMS